MFFPFCFVFLLPCLLYIAFDKSSFSFVFAKSTVYVLSDLLTLGHQVGPRTPDLEPDVGFICILHSCTAVFPSLQLLPLCRWLSPYLSSNSADLMVLGLAVSLVSLAAMVLSLRSIYLTPNPNPTTYCQDLHCSCQTSIDCNRVFALDIRARYITDRAKGYTT